MGGLTVSIFKSDMGDCSNGGISGKFTEAMVVGVERGNWDPSTELPELPRVMLKQGAYPGIAVAVPVQETPDGQWVPDGEGIGPMMGGCYISCSDSRFVEAVEKITGARFLRGGAAARPVGDARAVPEGGESRLRHSWCSVVRVAYDVIEVRVL